MRSCIDLPNQPGFQSIYAPHLQKAINIGLDNADEQTKEEAARDMNKILSNMRKAGGDVEDGATFNMDGSEYDGGGIALPVISVNTRVNEMKPARVKGFINRHKGKKGNIKVGVFKFKRDPESPFQPDKASMDLNIILQPWQKNLGLIIGKVLRQNSLFDLDAKESFYTGESGKNPLRISSKQFALIQEHLDKGTLPPFIVEKYNKLGGPIINNKGETVLTHWSKQGPEQLAKTDGFIRPSFYGTGKPGSNRFNKLNYASQWVDFTSYGINVGKKGGYKKEPGLGNHKYEASIEVSELYDWDNDPAGLLDIAKEVVSKEGLNPAVADKYTTQVYVKLISDAGFSGFWSKKGANGITASVFRELKPDSHQIEQVDKPKPKPPVKAEPPVEPVPPAKEVQDIVTGAKTHYDVLLNQFSDDRAKQVINKLDKPKIITSEGQKGYQSPYNNKVVMPLVIKGREELYHPHVVLHEYGHHLDWVLMKKKLGYNPYKRHSIRTANKMTAISNERLTQLLINDGKRLGLIFKGSVSMPTTKMVERKLERNPSEANLELGRKHLKKLEILKELKKELEAMEGQGMVGGISDMIDSVVGGQFRTEFYMPGHPMNYWKKSKFKKSHEAFANLFTAWAYPDKQYWNKTKELFPETTREFELIMEEVLNA